jgi:hypothetical protein
MTLELGYALSTAIFFGIFLVAVTAQVHARTYHRFLYWGSHRRDHDRGHNRLGLPHPHGRARLLVAKVISGG